MYDYATFVAGLAGNQAQFGSYSGPQATLYLFSPKLIPTQVLRPYLYNFTSGFVNDVINHPTTLQEAVAPNQNGKTDSVVQAILPDINGSVMNTYELSNTWSFVLSIDDNPITQGIRFASPAPGTRLIASGYVVGIDTSRAEEPVNPITGTINPRAVLVFTHSTMTFIQNEMGVKGGMRSYTTSHDSDLITPMNAAMATNGETLYLGTPGDLMNCTDFSNPDQPATAFGDLVIGTGNISNGSKTVDGVLKSPKHQLNTIMHSMDEAITYSEDSFVKSSIMPVSADYEDHRIRGQFAENLPNSRKQLPKTGLDTTQPMSMAHLTQLFPNIVIRPFSVPNQGGWSVSPQDAMSCKNQMSSLIASTISSVMPGVGLCSISFRYNSWTKADQFMAIPAGMWQIYEPVSTFVETSGEEQIKIVNYFKKVLENELFPILRSVRGEFDLMAFCNLGGEILLNLNFLCDIQGGKVPDALEGVYETNGRLGGLLNPMVGPYGVVNSNIGALMNFSREVIDQRVGPQSYHPSYPELDALNEQPVYSGVGQEPTWNNQPPFQGGSVVPDQPQQTVTSSFSNYTL